MESSAGNAWVESYLSALLTFGLSGEYTGASNEKKGPDADRSLYSRYYVQSLLKLSEEDLKSAWSKAVHAGKHGNEKDARLEFLSWRIWSVKRKHAATIHHRHHSAAEDTLDFDPAAPEPTSNEYTSDEEAGEGTGSRTSPSAAISAAADALATSTADFSELSQFPTLRKLSVRLSQPLPTAKPSAGTDAGAFDSLLEEYMMSPKDGGGHTPMAAPMEPQRMGRLYVVMISLHGLVRGDRMELGRDSDTGGQVKYVVELARAMALHPAVHRVDLLTRLIRDPRVDPEYGIEEECISREGSCDDLGGAYIVRLPCGPTEKYIHKESLWPHVREFADRGVAHVSRTLAALADAGKRCELYCVHGHYADAGEAAVLMCATLDAPLVVTGHSLGRNKLEHLLSSVSMTRAEIEATYAISRRIEAEERCLDVAAMVFTSTQQEVDEQWGLYDGYQPDLARVLRFRRSYGRHMPTMKVSPPGLDFSSLKNVTMPEDPTLKEFEAQRALIAGMDLMSPHAAFTSPKDGDAGSSSAGLSGSASPSGIASPRTLPSLKVNSPAAAAAVVNDPFQHGPADIIPNGPPIWQDIARFLRNPLKPAILAMSRPDAKKNLTTLVKAFGEHAMLRELANLVLVMGNRDNIDSMATGSQNVLTQVLKLIDAHDLYGSVAYPKHHTQADISDIYLFARQTRGVFVNIALQEPFGLTVIEAAAHGVPTVATRNGGPVDIMATLHHGVVVEPTDSDAVAAALLSILTAPPKWDAMSTSGTNNIMAYSWPAHCKRYMDTMEAEHRFIKGSRRQDRTMSGLLTKRLSRLDLLGIADAADAGGVPPVSPLGSEHGDFGRHFSTPAELPISALGTSGTASPAAVMGVSRRVSGLSTDDLGVLESLQLEAARRTGAIEHAANRKRFVVIPLDSDKMVAEAAAWIQAMSQSLAAAGLAESVGIGVLSMLGFDSTYDHLASNGVDMDSQVDFAICNSGADLWLCGENGRWDADESYETVIDFEWDRISLHRMLKKIVSAPLDSNQPLPRLKELLYNVAEAPEAGVHPRHICMELDPETQSILAAGMGPRAREAGGVRLAVAVVERLKRRLRAKGFRCNHTLQLVPETNAQANGSASSSGDFRAILHITPVRASRPLALRYLATHLGLHMDAFTLLVVPAEMKGSVLADTKIWTYVGDAPDVLAGMQQVFVTRPASNGSVSRLADAAGLSLEPWEDVDRVVLVARDAATAAIIDDTLKKLESNPNKN